jgi:putative heme-binding domain-containing protein
MKPYDPALVARLLQAAKAEGNPERGADVLASPRFACLSCHKVANLGGTIGPDLSNVATCLKPEEIVESIIWPRLKVKDGFAAVSVATADGKLRLGYEHARTTTDLVLRDPATAETIRIAQADIEAIRPEGSLMPEGLSESMTETERRDLVRFLLDLGRPDNPAAESDRSGHGSLRRVPRRGRDRAQGRVRATGRARRAGGVFQPRDTLL